MKKILKIIVCPAFLVGLCILIANTLRSYSSSLVECTELSYILFVLLKLGLFFLSVGNLM